MYTYGSTDNDTTNQMTYGRVNKIKMKKMKIAVHEKDIGAH